MSTLPYVRIPLIRGGSGSGSGRRGSGATGETAEPLVSQLPPPPSMPLVLQPHVSLAEWHSFWSDLHPIQVQVQASEEAIFLACFSLAVGQMIFLVALLFYYVFLRFDMLYAVLIGMSLGALRTKFNVWHGQVRGPQLHALRKVCRQAEAQIFGPCVECEYEEWQFYLYFMPIHMDQRYELKSEQVQPSGKGEFERNGYLRIQLLKPDGGDFFTWTPFSMVYLESFPTLPAILQMPTVNQRDRHHAQELWSRFWSEMLDASRHYLLMHRVYYTTLLPVMALLVLSNTSWLYDEASFVFIGVVLLSGAVLLIPFWHSSDRLSTAIDSRAKLVERYAAQFADRGWLVQYRRLYEFDGGPGISEAHYLYLFPLPAIGDCSG
jgi:hypothetical protein